eukprot:6207198-Pleurochrysis_carterae.AAC.2
MPRHPFLVYPSHLFTRCAPVRRRLERSAPRARRRGRGRGRGLRLTKSGLARLRLANPGD